MAKLKKRFESNDQDKPKGDKFSTLFGRVRVDQVEAEVPDMRFTVFDFVNDVNFGKQYLFTEETSADYDPFTMNRAMAIFPDTFAAGEFLNSNFHLDKRMQHDYLFYSVQKRKRWKQVGWLKKSEAEKREVKVLRDVARVVGYNPIRTKQFWSMLSEDQRKDFLERYVYPDSKNAKK